MDDRLPNRYDGATHLEMPRAGDWNQYIDSSLLFIDMSDNFAYAFVCIFTMPEAGGTQSLGFANHPSWQASTRQRVFKLTDGRIIYSNRTFQTDEDLDTGQQYVSGVPQGLMIVVSIGGAINLYYKNGGDKDIDSDAWVEITPPVDPDGLLEFLYLPDVSAIIGVNNVGSGGGTFLLDYIALIKNPPRFFEPTPTPSPTPTPTPTPLPGGTVVFEEDFEGDAQDPVNPDSWDVTVFDSPPPVLDGEGNLRMESTVSLWNGPRIESKFRFTPTGREIWVVDFKIDRAPLGISIVWIALEANGFEFLRDRSFMLHPTRRLKLYTHYEGEGQSTSGHGVFTDFFHPGNSPFTLRMVLKTGGTLEYYGDKGNGFVQFHPTLRDSDGFTPTQADLDLLNHYEFAPWLSYSLNVNPDGCCGSDVVWIDRITVTRIDLDDPPPLEPTPTPQPLIVILEDDFTNPAGPMPKPDEAPAPIPTGGNWRSNPDPQAPHNIFDGNTHLLMPRIDNLSQYIDTGPRSVILERERTYALVFIFTMPETGGGQVLGMPSDAGWSENLYHRVFKLVDGKIYYDQESFDLGSGIETGGTYVPGVPQGLMVSAHICDFGNFGAGHSRLWYQNGGDKDIFSPQWVELTPPDLTGVLLFLYAERGLNVGVANIGQAGGTFKLDYVALFQVPTPPIKNRVEPSDWILYE